MDLPFDLAWWTVIVIAIIAFACEFMDSSLGMGYGTTLTPILLLFGFEAYQIVPAILISEFATGLTSAGFHALFKNMSLGFERKDTKNKAIMNKLTKTGEPTGAGYPTSETDFQEIDVVMKKETFGDKLRSMTQDTKVVFVLALFGVFGTIISSVISVFFAYSSIFKFVVKIYIGVMVLAMGIIIVALRNKEIKFAMKRIISLGALAGFNKGISGGGYGPITVSGQILSGRDGKNAIASTSLAEGIVCFVGALAYIITSLVTTHNSGGPASVGELGLTPFLVIGAMLSTPLSALTTKKVRANWLKAIVGWMTMLLGAFTLIKEVLGFTGIW
ncbi:MAG: sulfite exporter TauE/SafE family protein [Asgard group archaeon]|nr:sulfite exporter TauE/SafE family protein [Asgard group archaeon]